MATVPSTSWRLAIPCSTRGARTARRSGRRCSREALDQRRETARAVCGPRRGRRPRRRWCARDRPGGQRCGWRPRHEHCALLGDRRASRPAGRRSLARAIPFDGGSGHRQRRHRADGGVAARHRRLGQPLREPDGGRQGKVWVGAHFGSRGFGHKTAWASWRSRRVSRSTVVRTRARWTRRPSCSRPARGSARPTSRRWSSRATYAYAGRDAVVAKVLEILGRRVDARGAQPPQLRVAGEHFGRTYWVMRKGCTPARPGQEGFVGGSIRVTHTLRPLGVAMAGRDVHDPYKD